MLLLDQILRFLADKWTEKVVVAPKDILLIESICFHLLPRSIVYLL